MTEPRDMSNTYRHMSIFHLKELKSRKLMRLRAIENSYSYLHKQEVRRIRYNLKQIEVEIECKEAQLSWL